MTVPVVMLSAAPAVAFQAACSEVVHTVGRSRPQPRAADGALARARHQHNEKQQLCAQQEVQHQQLPLQQQQQRQQDQGVLLREQPCRPGVYPGLVRGHVVVMVDSSWEVSREQIWEWLAAAYERALAAAPNPAMPVLVVAARCSAVPVPAARVAAAAAAVLSWVRAMRRPGAAERRVRMAPPLTYAPSVDGGGGAWGARLRCDECCAHWAAKASLPRDLGEKLRLA